MDRDWPEPKPAGATTLPPSQGPGNDGAGTVFDGALAAPWGILHVRSRQEKIVADALADAGVPRYLPRTTQIKYYNHRKRVSELPLFPGYVFTRAEPATLWAAMPRGKIVRLIPVADQRGLSADLAQVHRALTRGSGVTRVDCLPVGAPVRVAAGPLRDIVGLVERAGGSGRLVIGVRALGQGVSVEIEADLLEPMPDEMDRAGRAAGLAGVAPTGRR